MSTYCTPKQEHDGRGRHKQVQTTCIKKIWLYPRVQWLGYCDRTNPQVFLPLRDGLNSAMVHVCVCQSECVKTS